MDRCARVWLRLGDMFGLRPATFIGFTIGAMLFSAALGYNAWARVAAPRSIAAEVNSDSNCRAPLRALSEPVPLRVEEVAIRSGQ